MTSATAIPAVNSEQLRAAASEASQFLKLLANEHRLMILCHLMDGEKQVAELNELLDLSQSALSQHLAKLREAGLVSTRRDAQMIYYRLSSPQAEAVLHTLYRLYCA